MNYIKLINAFYDRLETNPLSTSAIALWHALVHINNKAGWQREFTVAVSVLCVKTGLSERTITNARNDLKVKGYLDFRSRKGSKSAIYSLNDLSVINDDKFTNVIPLSVINADNVSCNVSENTSDNVSCNVSALYKQNETKQNETNTAAVSLNFYDTYHICFNRPPSPLQVEEIKSFIDQDGLNDEVVCAAFKKASENGAGYPYARTIINSWIKKGIKTITDVESEQKKFEQQKQQRRNNNSGSKPIRTEILPAWFDNPQQSEIKEGQSVIKNSQEKPDFGTRMGKINAKIAALRDDPNPEFEKEKQEIEERIARLRRG
ncbi:MAG: hypothetical protein K0Q87_5475 [Neobacillus sp.]|nr:hypothetical protein [Neobacillus sp.]